MAKEVETMQLCPAKTIKNKVFDVEDAHQNYGRDSMVCHKLLPNIHVVLARNPKVEVTEV